MGCLIYLRKIYIENIFEVLVVIDPYPHHIPFSDSPEREQLRERVPSWSSLERLLGLEKAELNHMGYRRGSDGYFHVGLVVVAKPDLYPDVKSRLINAGVINQGNVESSRRGNKGKANECETLTLTFYGGNTKVFLTIYNPFYQPK